MKDIYCHSCGTLVISAEKGSKIRKNIVVLCEHCHNEIKNKIRTSDVVSKMFEPIFKKREG
jgi:RNase P subunit RPR2